MSAPEQQPGGYSTRRLVQFGRSLRAAGLAINAQQLSDVALAITTIDISRREDFYYALRALLVRSPDDFALFDQLFELFWLGRAGLLAEMGVRQQQPSNKLPGAPSSERAAAGRSLLLDDDAPSGDESDPAITPTYSASELLRQKDFGEFSDDEVAAARTVMQSLLWRMDQRPTRRLVRTSKQAANLDLPRAIQRSIRRGGEIVELPRRRRKHKPRPLVVICDVSGSMARYSRLFLYLMHSLVHGTARIETFVFGTRLTRITPALRDGDLDTAVARASELVLDWSGGTRIGESLRSFNYRWSRRVSGHGAVALIISDGWDRGDQDVLGVEIRRLRRNVHRLIWLNPLAGSPSYQPLVRGIQTILPHVDEMLPLHNLESMAQLAGKLGAVRR